jgi:hypothetical protein
LASIATARDPCLGGVRQHPEVAHADQGTTAGKRQTARGCEADPHAGETARAQAHRKAVEIGVGHGAFRHDRLDHGNQPLGMAPPQALGSKRPATTRPSRHSAAEQALPAVSMARTEAITLPLAHVAQASRRTNVAAAGSPGMGSVAGRKGIAPI